MLSDEEIEDCISEARKSLRRHRSAIRGQMCVPADQLDWHVARAVERAAYERAAQLVKPKSPRPCDCDACDCGNSGDLSAVIRWDEATMLAAAILALGRQHD